MIIKKCLNMDLGSFWNTKISTKDFVLLRMHRMPYNNGFVFSLEI